MRKHLKKSWAYLVVLSGLLLLSSQGINEEEISADEKVLVYKYEIKEQIAPAIWRITKKSFEEATNLGADLIIIHMNTYGGLLDAADSIRTMILNSSIPVFVFIDNNAASAGALIAIACDRIYMRPGGSIGAATVVDQTGQPVPDKYQSFMRSTMRATAEAHGRDTIIQDNDTIIRWHRDPKIAEAMVDPSVYIEGIIDTGKVLTFTTEEAIQNGYCEGQANNIKEVLQFAGIENYEIREYTFSATDRIIGFLLNPIVSGLLIMVIVGGIYFELQSPGIGFPLAAAVIAAILYFAPLYLEGLAQNWELIIFIIGLILIALEIFAIPGFGVAGVLGILLVIIGLTLAMVDNVVFDFDFSFAFAEIIRAFFIVITSMFLAFLLSLYIGKKLFTAQAFGNLALRKDLKTDDGFLGVESKPRELVGKTGIADSVLRPSGKVMIDDEIYDAKSEFGFINKGEKVKVIRYETSQIYVVKVEDEEARE
ncbi:MAG: serine protease [Bacteroides sp. SM23_62_1]|nr:MAG: serine protease [Bacteroides sp. SM23_62_1]